MIQRRSGEGQLTQAATSMTDGADRTVTIILSTGEKGASCPATTFVVSFDVNVRKVTGNKQLEGCSEFVETMADGTKLIVKKDAVVSAFLNGKVH